MTQNDTVTRILNAAETLFAEKGFSETTLRSITEQANVNLAAVNYHFGSKKALIQAVFVRFLNPFCVLLDSNLDAFEAQTTKQTTDLHGVLGVLERTLLASLTGDTSQERLSIFLRLLGLAYTQSQGHMRRFLKSNYDVTYKRIVSVIQESNPDVSENDLFWRIHFAVGSMIFTFSSIESLRAIANNDLHTDNTVPDIVKMLIPFIEGGINRRLVAP